MLTAPKDLDVNALTARILIRDGSGARLPQTVIRDATNESLTTKMYLQRLRQLMPNDKH